MTHSIFGWDLPPGCTTRDIERAAGGGDDPSPESEEVLALLERIHWAAPQTEDPQPIQDAVVKIVDDLARDRDQLRYLLGCAVHLLPEKGPEPLCTCKVPDTGFTYCNRHDTGWDEPTLREEIEAVLKKVVP